MRRTWLVNTTPHVCAHLKHASRPVMVLLAVIVALIALPASEAHAAPDTECRGTIGAVVVEGKIVVPDGAACVLIGTTVGESIIVGVESTLVANGIRVVKPGTVNIQASGATSIEVTGLGFGGGDPEELQPSELLGGIQAVGGGTVIIADTVIGGAVQILDNDDVVRLTEVFIEGFLQLAKNTGGVSVTGSFLGEGVEISETTGDVTFTGNLSDESDVTIAKTNGNVAVQDNRDPSNLVAGLGENFELSETSGHVIVSGNTVGDNLALSKITGGPVAISLPCDPLDPACTLGETVLYTATVIVVGNTVGDNIELLEVGGDVTFTSNVVEGSASIDKTTGQVTADTNLIGYRPPEPPEPGAELEPSEVASGGRLSVSEASEGASVGDNRITSDLEVSENTGGTAVSDNTAGGSITVAKNKGGTAVVGNTAGGDIECKDNEPPATSGGNVAGTSGSGSVKGECAGPEPTAAAAP